VACDSLGWRVPKTSPHDANGVRSTAGMPDIISKKTRNEFQEFFVGWTLRQIEQEFDAADIACDDDFTPNTSGQRRSLVQQV